MAETLIVYRQGGDDWLVLINHASATYQYSLIGATTRSYTPENIRSVWGNPIRQRISASGPLDESVTRTCQRRGDRG